MLHARILTPFTVAPFAVALVLAGCAKPPPPAAKPVIVAQPPPPHIGGPAAGLCDVSKLSLTDGATATITMAVSNEGGYCAARVGTSNGSAFDSYVLPLSGLPAHGTVKFTRYDTKTNLEYTPVTGYAGKDSFTAKLIVQGKPGYTTVTVDVTVQSRAAKK